MRSLQPLPAAATPILLPGKPSRLKVLDEEPPVRQAPAREPKELAPMPFRPVNGPAAELEWDDGFDDEELEIAPGRGGFSARRRLPRFVPFQPEQYTLHRDPWSVHSVVDMLRIYLPEISLSTGLVAIAGVLGGRLFSRFSGGADMWPVLAGYLSLHVLLLASSYVAAKGHPSARTRARMRLILLGCFLVLTTHLLANGLLMAGA